MSDNGQRGPLPGCMIGPSEPCDAFQRQTARIAELEAELAAERERREAAEAALGEVVDCNNSDPILIGREHGYRWYDVIARATAHFARYKEG